MKTSALRMFGFMAAIAMSTTDFVMPYDLSFGTNMTSTGYFGRGTVRPMRDSRYFFNRLVKRRKKNKLGKLTKSIQRKNSR